MDPNIPRRFLLSGWLVEGDLNRVTRGRETVQLEPKSVEVLCRLAATPGEVVSREALLQDVWSGRAVVDQVLTRAIGQLRTALGDDAQNPRLIGTVARRGYRLLVAVEAAPPFGGSGPRPAGRPRAALWAAGVLCLLAAALAALSLVKTAGPPAPIRAVAVRPFKVLAGGNVPDYYAEGLAESLITALSPVPGLRVIAGGSAFDRGIADLPLPELGQRLDVEGVIEGSLQRDGDVLRATVRLVRTRDRQVLWGGRAATLGAGEWFALQDQVVAQVIAAMSRPPALPQARTHTLSTTAHEDYLRARRSWSRRTPDALREAVAHFRRALEADPGYAQAHAGLAQSEVLLPFYGLAPPREAMPRARAAAERALSLDPGLAEAHAVRAVVHYQFEHDWQAAAAAFERALAASPGDATTHQWYAEFLGYAGHFERARGHIERAAALDPLSPVVATLRASPDVWARRCAEAERYHAETLAFAPDFPLALYSRALCLRSEGRLDEAVALYLRVLPRLGDAFVLASLANAEAARGDESSAREHARALERHAQRMYVPPYKFAVIHAGLGEREQAFARLQQAFAESDERLVLLEVDPHMDPLRQDPRFADLRRRVGLPLDRRSGGGGADPAAATRDLTEKSGPD